MTLVKHAAFFTFLTLSVFGSALIPANAKSWQASPIVVHEWGVNLHDWQGDPLRAAHDPDLPPFFYTDKKPGKVFPAPGGAKVKKLAPDSGIRFKPLVYFYGSGPIGLEARFEYGHANAWYPQVNVYRDPEMVKGAKAIDWDTWQKQNQFQFQITNSVAGRLAPVPDDPRFELVWHHLTLDEKLTPSALAPSEEHWLNIARDVEWSAIATSISIKYPPSMKPHRSSSTVALVSKTLNSAATTTSS